MINIAKQIAANPFVKIPCPNCGAGYLQILIAPWKPNEEPPKVDVHLICEHCGARNTITKEAEVVEKIAE
ncbi:MAG: hypothetical protein H6573_28435 [Lewinellaceae bacterium]|nr:hypothetical protein [Lewinellaceae bacterium]